MSRSQAPPATDGVPANPRRGKRGHRPSLATTQSTAQLFLQPSEGYDLFAVVYGRTMAEDFFCRCWPAIQRLLLADVTSGARIVDLCCGAGQIAGALSKRGFRVTGVDASTAMIALARNHAPEAHFFAADARSFGIAIPQDAAVCTFNSLAHIYTASELRQVFTCVKSALRENATFLFDLTMEEGYVHSWRGSFQLNAAGHTCTVNPGYDSASRLASNRITVAPASTGEGGNPACFTILQKCHSEEEITRALHDTGFAPPQSFDAECDLGIASDFGRRFFRTKAKAT